MVKLRARANSLRAPLLTAGLALAAVALVAVVDPHEPGTYPPCPWRMLTELWCPACGGLRATHHLATGDPVAAIASNALIVALLPVMGVLWSRWLLQRWRGESPEQSTPPTLSARATVVLVVVAAVFTVARNLPAGAALAP